MPHTLRVHRLWLVALLGLLSRANAHEIYNDAGTSLNADVVAVYGIFNSQHHYAGGTGGAQWREGFVKYGLSGTTNRIGVGSMYGALSMVSSGTWGDGDPAGYTSGRERRTSLEEAYLGWRSGNQLPALGTDGLDVSVGRQVVKVGTGFLIEDDGFNPGRQLADASLDRGGAYYLAARHAFGNTAVVRVGGTDGLHGRAIWLKSNNLAQARTALAAGTLDYSTSAGTIGLTYVRGLSVDKRLASPSQLARKDMNIYSIRGQGNAGIENADFAFEYARQRKSSGTNTAWYGQAGYTFADLAWRPSLRYRYTRYSKDWDLLFTGGMPPDGWFQGEVASNFAGTYANNVRIHNISLTLEPHEKLTLGAVLLDFKTVADRSTLNLDARELDLFVAYSPTKNLTIIPTIGFYKPKKWQGNGGNQSGSASTNVYTQIVLAATF